MKKEQLKDKIKRGAFDEIFECTLINKDIINTDPDSDKPDFLHTFETVEDSIEFIEKMTNKRKVKGMNVYLFTVYSAGYDTRFYYKDGVYSHVHSYDSVQLEINNIEELGYMLMNEEEVITI